MSRYEELKIEIPIIGKLVGELPPEVRHGAFDALVSAFLDQDPNRLSTSHQPSTKAAQSRTKSAQVPIPSKGEATKSDRKRETSRESYQIDRALDLRGNESVPSLKQFVSGKKPGSARELNAIAVYYLKKILNLEEATLNHAYTCYVEVGRRPPDHFKQSFIDTKNKVGWIEFDDQGRLQIPHRGVVFVEHDLPKTMDSKGEGD
jgi:hypothetical protein